MLDYILIILIKHLFKYRGTKKNNEEKVIGSTINCEAFFYFFLDMLVNCEFCFVYLQIEDYFIDFGRYFFYGEI